MPFVWTAAEPLCKDRSLTSLTMPKAKPWMYCRAAASEGLNRRKGTHCTKSPINTKKALPAHRPHRPHNVAHGPPYALYVSHGHRYGHSHTVILRKRSFHGFLIRRGLELIVYYFENSSLCRNAALSRSRGTLNMTHCARTCYT
jgi:hypothetical protein